MRLEQELVTQGNFLFRWRSYLPLVLLPLLFGAMHYYDYLNGTHTDDLPHIGDYAWEALCLSVSLLGLLVRAYVVGYTPAGTSGRNTETQIAETLNVSGAYSLVRHPLYVGNYLMWLGIAMFSQRWEIALLVTLIYWVYYERIMAAEEAFLANKFGEAYKNWSKSTPAFIPRFSNYQKPDAKFSLRNVLRREYNGFFAVITLIFGLEVYGDYLIHNELMFDHVGLAVFLGSLAIWFVLRSVKRHTNWLNVEGR